MTYFQCPQCKSSLDICIKGETDEPEFKASCERCGWRGKVKDLVVVEEGGE
jgi:hypothetical protein